MTEGLDIPKYKFKSDSITYSCPDCGKTHEQKRSYYDMSTAALCVLICPDCRHEESRSGNYYNESGEYVDGEVVMSIWRAGVRI